MHDPSADVVPLRCDGSFLGCTVDHRAWRLWFPLGCQQGLSRLRRWPDLLIRVIDTNMAGEGIYMRKTMCTPAMEPADSLS